MGFFNWNHPAEALEAKAVLGHAQDFYEGALTKPPLLLRAYSFSGVISLSGGVLVNSITHVFIES